jgi:hypothetical protein
MSSRHRSTSLRASARGRYLELAASKGSPGQMKKDDPLPDPPPFRGREGESVNGEREKKEGGGENKESLMQQVRRLYEDGVVPVREIARLAGITERTLYKYIAKGGWRRRYAMPGVEAAAKNRGRVYRPAPGFAPVTGAGGRFIPREDAGKPFARGIKATDAAGRARANVDCAQAETVARRAAQAAAAERESLARYGLFNAINDALFEVAKWLNETRGDARLRARMEALQHRVMDSIERLQLVSLAPRAGRWTAKRSG